MQSAARGALSVPPGEMIEILVYLATNNKILGHQAQLTLAGWEESSARTAAADPNTAKEVLDYWLAPENLRPALLPALIENPAVSENALSSLASSGSRETAQVLLKSERVKRSRILMIALNSNPNLTEVPGVVGEQALPAVGAPAMANAAATPAITQSAAAAAPASAEPLPAEPQPVGADEEVVTTFLHEHASEIAAEGSKAFQLTADPLEELVHTTKEAPAEAEAAAAAAAAGTSPADSTAATVRHAPIKKKSFLGAGHEKGSALQKIAQLDVKGRIQLAMKGDKEERSLLIRDGTKVVALAVLESPKVTDSEVEKFASQKNVLEAVLRGITMKRRFMKQYPIIRNLAFNPRVPIDVTLGLLKHLLIQDLRNLSGNKEVSETVRKLALKMFKQKVDTASQRK
jgi:hypothetical protein